MGKKPRKERAGSSAPKPTIETISDDQVYSLTEQHKGKYERLLKAKKDADKELTDFGKIIKSDLGPKGLQDIKDLIALSTPEGEAVMKAEMERQARVMRWMNIPIGSQGALFGEEDRTPLTERAFNEGKRQGLAGESCDNPHHHTTEAHRSYNDGWAAGQEAKATAGFQKLETDEDDKTWLERTKEQNDAVEADIKKVSSDLKKAALIGSSRPTFEVH